MKKTIKNFKIKNMSVDKVLNFIFALVSPTSANNNSVEKVADF